MKFSLLRSLLFLGLLPFLFAMGAPGEECSSILRILDASDSQQVFAVDAIPVSKEKGIMKVNEQTLVSRYLHPLNEVVVLIRTVRSHDTLFLRVSDKLSATQADSFSENSLGPEQKEAIIVGGLKADTGSLERALTHEGVRYRLDRIRVGQMPWALSYSLKENQIIVEQSVMNRALVLMGFPTDFQ